MKMIRIALLALLAATLSGVALGQGPGPGPTPSPWVQNGNVLSYSGAVTLPAGVTGGQKGNGTINATGVYSAGVQLHPTTGGFILYGNGTGGFSNVTIGSGVSFAAGTLSATGTGGTVTSVAMSVPSFLSVAGSPITTSGTLAVTLATQTANTVFAGPTTGSAAAPTYRSLVGADLPNPSSSTKGGVQSAAAVTHQWINSISTSGVPSLSQPACGDLSNGAASCSTDTTVASNIGSGTLPSGRISGSYTGLTGTGTLTAGATGSGFTVALGTSTLTGNLPVANLNSGTSASATTFWRGDATWATPSAASLTGNLPVANLNSGTSASSSTFWRGDGTWATPGGSGTVNSGTAGQMAYYASTGTAISGTVAPISPPQGRLTLTSATPVLTSTVSGATNIYYALYNGNQIPIYNGTNFMMMTFAEATNVTTASSSGSAGPAAVTTNSNYDLLMWAPSGVCCTLTRSPAWTSDTARGTGAGTAELQRVSGIWTNKVAVTNGPGAGLGTYVGTVRSDGSSQINWIVGGKAAGGTAAVLGVWNTYNRVSSVGYVYDSTASWNYATATYRPTDNSTAMRVSYLQGLQEDGFSTQGSSYAGSSLAADTTAIGFGHNSTTTPAAGALLGIYQTPMVSIQGQMTTTYSVQDLGWNYIQQLEIGPGSASTVTWLGNVASYITGMTYSGRF